MPGLTETHEPARGPELSMSFLAGTALAVTAWLLVPLSALAKGTGPGPAAQDGRPAPVLSVPPLPPPPAPQLSQSSAPPAQDADASQSEAAPAGQAAQAELPPLSELPSFPRGPAPPAVVMGVLSVPDVMREALAAQQAQRTLGPRQQELAEDAQNEQAAWREEEQALLSQRGKLPADRLRARAQALQQRVAAGQRRLRDRAGALERSNQAALGQIQQMLVAVIRQVAESRGMNLVLHRGETALNVDEFDVTRQVTEQLNKVLPTIDLPPAAASVGAAPPRSRR